MGALALAVSGDETPSFEPHSARSAADAPRRRLRSFQRCGRLRTPDHTRTGRQPHKRCSRGVRMPSAHAMRDGHIDRGVQCGDVRLERRQGELQMCTDG
eukprot:6177752-Pleurochrysis_carterae.AAC.2